MLKLLFRPISLYSPARKYCWYSTKSIRAIFAVVAGFTSKPFIMALSVMTPCSPLNNFFRNRVALSAVLSSVAEMMNCARLFTSASNIVMSFSLMRVQYRLNNGSKPIIIASLRITTQSSLMVKLPLKFKAGFATVASVGIPYTSGSPPKPPLKAYSSPLTFAQIANPFIINSFSSSTCGIVSGSPSYLNIASARLME